LVAEQHCDVESYRERFPIFNERTYVNSCSQGALANEVRAAYETYLHGLEEFGSLWETWVGVQERVRSGLALTFSCDESEVAITSCASSAVSAIASSFDFTQQRNTVVTTSLEFPTIGQIWHAQERRGARVVHVPASQANELSVSAIADAIDDSTALVSVTHVCYRNGAMTPVSEIVEVAHERGVPVLVDAYQSVGAVPIDFRAMGADFLVGGVLKYMLGSPGVCFALVNSATTAEFVPTTTGWFAARDIFAMDIYKFDPAKDARRFESGTPVVPSLYAADAGLGLLNEVGVDRAWAVSRELHEQLRGGIEHLGGRVVTPRHDHGPMIAVASSDDHALVAAMANDGVVVSCRDGNVRISPHFYNNASDMDAVLASLARHRHLLVNA
jgi:selenocysteine lyase/cysteine desulfurase